MTSLRFRGECFPIHCSIYSSTASSRLAPRAYVESAGWLVMDFTRERGVFHMGGRTYGPCNPVPAAMTALVVWSILDSARRSVASHMVFAMPENTVDIGKNLVGVCRLRVTLLYLRFAESLQGV